MPARKRPRSPPAGTVDRAQARKFFEDNFKPVRILPEVHSYGYYTGADGFYTGYYEAEVAGSRVKTADYDVPLYGVPAKLAGKKSRVFAQYDRTEIDKGALAGKGLEICWIRNPVDAFFAQIQGSTRVKLDDGELLRLNYIASNGKPYTPVGRLLIDQGIYTPEEMSMDKIREYMEANPEEGKELREKNRSFVFFSATQLGPTDECLGAQGIPLTPWRSLAVDPTIHVYGTPIWIDAKFPITSDLPQDTFQHLMIAQDTGSAIRGAARADIYFGHGEDIPHIAGRIKQFGKFVMLVPKDVSVSGSAPETVPLPRPRPTDIVADNTPTGFAPGAAQAAAMNAGGGNRRRVLSYEERVLWTTVTKAIEPLRASAHFDAGDDAIMPVAPPARPAKFADAIRAARAAPPLAPARPPHEARVARGKQAIDARLDLHGLTQAQAHSALLRFLRSAHARDARLVLVITGKGRGDEPGVLKRQVPQWLGLPEFRSTGDRLRRCPCRPWRRGRALCAAAAGARSLSFAARSIGHVQ